MALFKGDGLQRKRPGSVPKKRNSRTAREGEKVKVWGGGGGLIVKEKGGLVERNAREWGGNSMRGGGGLGEDDSLKEEKEELIIPRGPRGGWITEKIQGTGGGAFKMDQEKAPTGKKTLVRNRKSDHGWGQRKRPKKNS